MSYLFQKIKPLCELLFEVRHIRIRNGSHAKQRFFFFCATIIYRDNRILRNSRYARKRKNLCSTRSLYFKKYLVSCYGGYYVVLQEGCAYTLSRETGALHSIIKRINPQSVGIGALY